MTENKKETEKTIQLEQAILELAKDIVQGVLFNRLKTEKVSEMLVLAGKHYKLAKDKRLYQKIFFQKVGNTTLYNALNLKQYFLDFGVGFEYNTKKEQLWILGNPETIEQTFSDWKQAEKARKANETSLLSEQQKLERRFKSSFEKLNKQQKNILKEMLK